MDKNRKESKMNGWIPIGLRHPKDGERVLVCTFRGGRQIGVAFILRDGNKERIEWGRVRLATNDYVAYWMPLPEPPSGVKK